MYLKKILIGTLLATAGASSLYAIDNLAGSLLIYPIYEHSGKGGSLTFVTVTNTNVTEDVAVEFIYIDGETCLETNRTEELTPLDTLTVLTSYHNPNWGEGYVYAFAKESVVGDPISFNYLVGDVEVLTGFFPVIDAMNAYSFQGIGDDGSLTDLNDNGMRDLDGAEYSMAPDEIVVPRFWANGFNKKLHTETGLTLIALTGGSQFSTTVDFLVYNDNEQAFSSEYTFDCYTRIDLTDVSSLFSQDFLENHTNDDPDEVHQWYNSTGWFTLNGAVASSMTTSIPDPAVLAHVTHTMGIGGGKSNLGYPYSRSSQLPFHRGTQSNGSLLAHSQSGN